MFNIMAMKKKAAESKTEDSVANNRPKSSAAQIRIQKDLSELDTLPSTMHLSFPNPDDMFSFELTIKPDEGYYRGGTFQFSFRLGHNYPHEPPKVQCKQKVYHPNIDLDGNVCLNILREDWKPVLNLNAVLVGLLFLFLEPNGDDPLNKDAASVLRNNPESFKHNVSKTMKGGVLGGVSFDRVL